MKFITLSIPSPFSTGPQYDEDGNLEPGSWPAGLPHKGIQGWTKLGVPSGGRELCDFVCDDDWPIGDIPNGWKPDGEHQWDGRPDTYDENGDLLESGIDTLIPTDYVEYNKHLETDVDYRVHVIAGWPLLRD